MKLRSQILLLGLLPMLLVAIGLGVLLIYSRLADLEDTIQVRGTSLVSHLVQHVQTAGQDSPMTTEKLAATLSEALKEKGVLYARALSSRGTVIAQVLAPEIAAKGVPQLNDSQRGLFAADVSIDQAGADAALQLARIELALSYADYWRAAWTMLWGSLLIFGIGCALAALLIYRLTKGGLRPFLDVIATVQRLAGGDLQARMATVELNEIGQLQQGINQMGESLEVLRDKMRQQVVEATAELTRQKEAAEQANRAKSKFLAAASHDLRQPMHAIGLFTAALQPHVGSDEGKAILDKIQASLSTTESLFSTVLDVSKLDAGIITPQLARVSVAHLLERLRDDFQYEAASKGLKLHIHSLPLQVMSDPVLLDRILRNLVSNALRYSDHGGVLIAARRRGDAICFQVWDTGIGIPGEHVADIFAEFYQVQTLKRDRAKGLGLGLAIVDRLVRLLGHRLDVRSKPGKGTVFSVAVPLATSESAAGKVSNEINPASYTRLIGQVLVIDDDESVLDALTALLQGWGLDVLIARSGEEAIAQLVRPPSLMLTDFRLSVGETGLDVVDKLHRKFAQDDIPVVVITGDTTEVVMQAIAAKGFPMLHKPVQPAKLRALVSRLLRREAASA